MRITCGGKLQALSYRRAGTGKRWHSISSWNHSHRSFTENDSSHAAVSAVASVGQSNFCMFLRVSFPKPMKKTRLHKCALRTSIIANWVRKSFVWVVDLPNQTWHASHLNEIGIPSSLWGFKSSKNPKIIGWQRKGVSADRRSCCWRLIQYLSDMLGALTL